MNIASFPLSPINIQTGQMPLPSGSTRSYKDGINMFQQCYHHDPALIIFDWDQSNRDYFWLYHPVINKALDSFGSQVPLTGTTLQDAKQQYAN